MSDGVRIDKWLWAARFFKTRGLATEAVNGGHVHIDGQAVKPARAVKIGERLTIRRSDELYNVTVTGLAEKRGSASVAQTLYEESAESMAAREEKRQLKKLASAPAPERRPDKRARRQLTQLRRSQG